jgi:hypothetical protein
MFQNLVLTVSFIPGFCRSRISRRRRSSRTCRVGRVPREQNILKGCTESYITRYTSIRRSILNPNPKTDFFRSRRSGRRRSSRWTTISAQHFTSSCIPPPPTTLPSEVYFHHAITLLRDAMLSQGPISLYSGRDCVKSPRSSYTGVYPQTIHSSCTPIPLNPALPAL